MANREHVEIVLKGAEAIENWRLTNLNVRLNLQGADLRRVKLEHADLSQADMRESDLEWGDLRWSDLAGTELQDANLTRADLHKSDLSGANLSGAKLKLTNFEDANLSNADLTGASFENARIINTDFSGAKGLDSCSHPKTSLLDQETISVNDDLPVEFLKGCGLSEREIKSAVKQLVSAEVFSDFLGQAEYLLSEGYKDAAAVIIGGVLEQKLRQLCEFYKIPVVTRKNEPKKFNKMNEDLRKDGVYNLIDQRNIQACYDIRNMAAHGNYDKYTHEQVENMLRVVCEFLARHKDILIPHEEA